MTRLERMDAETGERRQALAGSEVALGDMVRCGEMELDEAVGEYAKLATASGWPDPRRAGPPTLSRTKPELHRARLETAVRVARPGMKLWQVAQAVGINRAQLDCSRTRCPDLDDALMRRLRS